MIAVLIRNSIVVSIPACHAGDRGSIPRFGDLFILLNSSLITAERLTFWLIFTIHQELGLVLDDPFLKRFHSEGRDSNSR